ncbi:MAG: lytic murein transglycosylase [Alphaproteobacteria bacterium]|nr:lytic murein transglycosylase [Alphaproteobacteria bacterium]
MRKFRLFFILFALIFHAFSVSAADDFALWKTNIYQKALELKISKNILDKYFLNVEYLPNVIELDRKQPEFTVSFGRYMKRMVSENRIQTAQDMFQKHNRLLGRIENRYGIPAHYLLAFWALETNFGKNKGNTDILNALSTLSFDKRRTEFFSEQLMTLLKILQEENISPPKGSWAGAFGHFQFIPTTFYQYAVDEDQDGRRDIIFSFEDAISSAANYLSKMGWEKDKIWGRQVILVHPEIVQELGAFHPLSFWVKNGVMRADGKEFTPDTLDIQAKLLLPEGINGPAFLTYKNFDVIKRWNLSDSYALAVCILADKIVNRSSLDVDALPIKPDLKNDDISFVQKVLKKQGFYNGNIDGILGKDTKKAIKSYQKNNNLVADGFLSESLISSFKSKEFK